MLTLSFIASIIVSALGILQKLGVGPVKTFLNTYYSSIYSSYGYAIPDVNQRITSTLVHYSGLGAYLSFTIIVALVCYIAQKRLKISPLLLAVTFLLDSTALVLTGTIAAWVGLVVGAAVVFILVRRLPKTVIFILVGIVLAVLIFQPFISARLDEQLGAGAAQGLVPSSLAFRIMLWRDIFFPAIGQHLLFGAGPTPAVLDIWPSEESQYLLLLLRGGLLNLFSYFLLIGVAITACWRQIRSKSEDATRLVAIALIAILVAINVMNVSGEYFTYVGGTQTLWTLLAIIVASGQLKTLGASAASKRVVDGNWRAISTYFRRSPGIAPAKAVDRSATESWLARENDSYTLIPNYVGPVLGRVDRYHRRFSWLESLLDWHFVQDSVVVGAGFTIARILGLLFWILLAQFLTPDDFGFVRYSISLATIITIASTASPVSITRFLAANPNDQQARDRYFSNGLVGVAILLALSLLISVPILWLLRALNLGTILCIVGLTGFFSYFAVARGLGNTWKMGLSYLLSNVVQIAAIFVAFSLFGLHTTTFALAIYGLAYLSPVALMLFSSMKVNFRRDLISKNVLLELARFAMPLVVATGIYTIWYSIDVLLIQISNPHVSGSYAAAKTLSQAFILVPSAITMVLMPRVAALRPGSDKSKHYIASAVLAAFLICLVGFVIVDFWGHTLITLIFGGRYSDAYLPLLVLSAGMSIYSVYVILEGFVLGCGRPNLAVKALLVALISSGVTCFWLISWLGTLGASLSFTIGAALGTAVILLNTWRFIRREKQLSKSELSSADLTAVTTI